MKPKRYKDSDAYKEYLAGEGGAKVRLNNIPAFEIIGTNTVRVAAGEVYCRLMLPSGEMCRHNEMFSNESNLRSHINRHRGVTVKTRGSGMLKMSDDDETLDFYKELVAYVHNHNDAEQESDTLESIMTPVKTHATKKTKKAKKLKLPTAQIRGTFVVSVKQLSMIAEHPDKCDICESKKRKCPTAKRSDCAVWALFEVDAALENTRPPPVKRKTPATSPPATRRSARKTPKVSLPVVDDSDDDGEIKTLEVIRNRFRSDRDGTFADFKMDCTVAIEDLQRKGGKALEESDFGKDFDIAEAWNKLLEEFESEDAQALNKQVGGE